MPAKSWMKPWGCVRPISHRAVVGHLDPLHRLSRRGILIPTCRRCSSVCLNCKRYRRRTRERSNACGILVKIQPALPSSCATSWLRSDRSMKRNSRCKERTTSGSKISTVTIEMQSLDCNSEPHKYPSIKDRLYYELEAPLPRHSQQPATQPGRHTRSLGDGQHWREFFVVSTACLCRPS